MEASIDQWKFLSAKFLAFWKFFYSNLFPETQLQDKAMVCTQSLVVSNSTAFGI